MQSKVPSKSDNVRKLIDRNNKAMGQLPKEKQGTVRIAPVTKSRN